MTTNPPPYAPPPESKGGIYPSVPQDPYQQPQSQQPPQSVGYYPQQPAPAGSPGYYPAQQQQPPQQIVVSQPPVVVAQSQPQSFVAHIVLSCFVFWCCGCLCGLVAFILASKSISIVNQN